MSVAPEQSRPTIDRAAGEAGVVVRITTGGLHPEPDAIVFGPFAGDAEAQAFIDAELPTEAEEQADPAIGRRHEVYVTGFYDLGRWRRELAEDRAWRAELDDES